MTRRSYIRISQMRRQAPGSSGRKGAHIQWATPLTRGRAGALARQGSLTCFPSGFDSRPAYHQISSYLDAFLGSVPRSGAALLDSYGQIRQHKRPLRPEGSATRAQPRSERPVPAGRCPLESTSVRPRPGGLSLTRNWVPVGCAVADPGR